MVISGIGFGLGAAFLQAMTYFWSRLYLLDPKRNAVHLLITSHMMLGTLSVILLPLVWSPECPPIQVYLKPLILCTAFYLIGQLSLFFLIRHVQASRAAPLLGFKIVVLALISAFLGPGLRLHQWAAVGVATTAILILNLSGNRLSNRSLFWLLTACIGYSLSDMNIQFLFHALHPMSMLRASLYGTCTCYALAGFISLFALPITGIRCLSHGWKFSLPYAICWFLGIILLFACFGLIGALAGNIIQSFRGLIAIAAGAILSRAGHLALEPHVSRRIIALRTAAALLLTLSLWLYTTPL